MENFITEHLYPLKPLEVRVWVRVRVRVRARVRVRDRVRVRGELCLECVFLLFELGLG